MGGEKYAMEAVEINIAISVRYLGTVLGQVEADMYCMYIDSDDAAK